MSEVVWVVQKPVYKDPDGNWRQRFDLSDAEQFGNLRAIFEPGDRAENSDLYRPLQRFTSLVCEGDYLLCLGDPALIARAAAAWSHKGHTLRILKWDRRNKKYILCTL